jgi:hypothetical protein
MSADYSLVINVKIYRTLSLTDVLYVSEHRLRAYENPALRRASGPKREEVVYE